MTNTNCAVQHGLCQHCGRDYRSGDDLEIVSGDCPANDCPSNESDGVSEPRPAPSPDLETPWEIGGRQRIFFLQCEAIEDWWSIYSGKTLVALAKEPAHVRLIHVAPKLLHAAKRTEEFIRGFEDDDRQDGIDELLSSIRTAIAEAAA